MPIYNVSPVEELNYEWVGTFYGVVRTYRQYRVNWEARKRFLDLQKLEKEGRVRREKVNGGYIYNDYKLKHRFFVENLLVNEGLTEGNRVNEAVQEEERNPHRHTERDATGDEDDAWKGRIHIEMDRRGM
jgi:hypothetical protein